MLQASDFYNEQLTFYSGRLKEASSLVRRFGWYRFAGFAGIFIPLFIFGWKWITVPFSLTSLILFFFLVKKNIKLERQKKRYEILKKISSDELKALSHQFNHFKNGEEYLNVEHSFSYDLDLFGNGSLFQFINRTSTVGGEHKLASWLIKPLKNKTLIESRQKAIEELAGIPKWRLNFMTEGNLFNETEQLNDEVKEWSGKELDLNRSNAIKWVIRIVPVLTLLAFIPSFLGYGNLFWAMLVSCQFILMYFSWKRINQYYIFFGRKSELLAKYMQLLQVIENAEFKSQYLKDIQKKVKSPSAGKAFAQLKSLVKEFEYRQNILVGVFLNGVFTWDIRCVYKLWCWHQKYREKLTLWLDVLSEIDALISLANFKNNHPELVFPELSDDEFSFQAENLGHPLLKRSGRVTNDIEIEGWSKVLIVTGANMAGKSTFLRTVGVNLILAGIGAPVCAKRMNLTPVDLYTNMRTTDSLFKDESYFFAELKRIKSVLERLKKGERIFVILDEMLKGTNSVDKLNGSRELVRKLVALDTVALIATHDLKLSEMEQEFPKLVFNKCFEIRIENNELVFDYKLSDGVTQTMNATFLMKKMGII